MTQRPIHTLPSPVRAFARGRLIALVALNGLLLACGTDGADDPGGAPDSNQTTSDLARNLTPEPTAAELRALADGNHALTVELYKRTATTGDNYMVSTHSILAAFSMVYAGAAGQTATEMSNVLRLDPDPQRWHEAMNAVDLALASRQMPPSDKQAAVELQQANAFWGHLSIPWRSTYLDTLAVNYGAGVHAADFENTPEASRETINEWVEDRTNDRIEDLLPDGSITSDTLAVLTNAIYFKAPWETAFRTEATEAGSFDRIDGTTASADFMRADNDYGYATGAGWTAVELPYRGDALSMVMLVPDSGTFSTFDAALTHTQVTSAIAALQTRKITLFVPKFEFKTEITLSETLQAMGMVTPFGGSADLSGMAEGVRMAIDEAFHQTFVAIDEEGTEAAAATAVVIIRTSAPVATLRIDRPFYFVIRDKETDVWLFFGRVLDPSL